MNFVDVFILLVLAVCVLGGYYKGFLSTLVRIGMTLLSFFLALSLSPLLSGAVRGQQDLYDMLLYYTEGSEYVAATDVELTRAGIAQVTSEKLREVLRSLQTPTLILGGTDDPISTPALMTRTACCLPHCKMVMYSGCGHNIDTDIPEELAEEADRFLSE